MTTRDGRTPRAAGTGDLARSPRPSLRHRGRRKGRHRALPAANRKHRFRSRRILPAPSPTTGARMPRRGHQPLPSREGLAGRGLPMRPTQTTPPPPPQTRTRSPPASRHRNRGSRPPPASCLQRYGMRLLVQVPGAGVPEARLAAGRRASSPERKVSIRHLQLLGIREHSRTLLGTRGRGRPPHPGRRHSLLLPSVPPRLSAP